MDSSGSRAARSWDALFLLAVWLSIVPGLERPANAPREALVLFGVPLVAALSIARRPFAPSRGLGALLAIALVGGTAGLALAPVPELAAVARDLALLVALWLLAWIGSSAPGEADDRVAWAAAVAVALAGLAGLAQAWFGWAGLPQARPPGALFANRNMAAEAFVVLVPLAAAARALARGPAARWSVSLACGLGAAALVATRSRGGWAGALLGWGLALALMVLTGRARRGAAPGWRAPYDLVAAIAIVVLALLVPVRGTEPLPSVRVTVASLSRGDTVSVRRALAANTWDLARERPLAGWGAGRFAAVYPLAHDRSLATPGFGLDRQPEHAENEPLEFAAELGLPAALAQLAALFGAIALSLRALCRAADGAARAHAAARLAALAGVAVHGLVSFPLHSPASAVAAWWIVGRAWSAGGRLAIGSPALRRALVVAGAALALAGGAVGAREIAAQARLNAALAAHGRAECGAALDAARAATRRAPWLRRDVSLAAMLGFACEKDPARSLELLEPALAKNPHQLNLLLATGARRLKAGRLQDADAAFRHALEIDRTLGRAWLGLAMTAGARGDAGAQAEACRQALAAPEVLPETRVYCGGGGPRSD
ncbi:MAG: O-antigen ligase family protein [Acidobacteria bacterium]|nr:O-antigen ligase family protein [Acidobacteriota bacterium]